jgi:hypothetical protein
VKERPINLKEWEVRAILDGRKTQTRRVVKPQPKEEAVLGFLIPQPNAKGSCAHFHAVDEKGVHTKDLTVCFPYGQPGDRLWVREKWMDLRGEDRRWKSPVTMPRWASRITLEIESVRVERLNEISEEDAITEGLAEYVPQRDDLREAGKWWDGPSGVSAFRDPRNAYAAIWEADNFPGSWDENPRVWAVTFRLVLPFC